MSAELLRRAADKLREYAQDAENMYRENYRAGIRYDTWEQAMAERIHDDVLDYVALMDPPLGLLLADLLEFTAESTEPGRRAIAVARLILREDS